MRWIGLVCVLSVLASGQDAKLQKRIDAAIDKGCAALFRLQSVDGSFGSGVGQHALVMLALLHSKVDKNHPAIRKALRPLRKPARRNYALALRLTVMDEIREEGMQKMARADAYRIMDNQGMSGGWDYEQTGERTDNSCTQYALLGLRAADNMGLQLPVTAWRNAMKFLLTQLKRDGGMAYTRDREATSSMTAGAIASLVSVKARVKFKSSDRRSGRLVRAINKATRWLAKDWKPGRDPHGYYTLYGLERAMAFAGQDRLVDRNWYVEGARWLLSHQRKDGFWKGQGNRNSTAFALLFLSRASKPTGSETPGSVHGLMSRVTAQTSKKQVLKIAAIIARRGKSAIPLLVHYLSDKRRTRRRCAIAALRGITGSTRGYDPDLTPAENADAIEAWKKAVAGSPK
ncbi:MAG: hypothetical protein CMJ18_15530 [Phycisphaeraceae bacterium]|nr:hypothetical protein [Phycisphaeraceae bacterium]